MAYRPGVPDITLTCDEVNAAVHAAFPAAAGGSCVELSRSHAVAERPIDPAASRPGGFVSGPAQFAMADSALWFMTFGVLDRVELMALTADLDISFLRPASGSVLRARADLLSAGSRKIVGSVRVWCDDALDAPTAVAKGTYVLPATR